MASECAYAEELYDLVPIQVIQWINVVTSISSIVLVSYTASNYLHRTIFEKVTKELIIALYAFISVFSVCIILTQVMSNTQYFDAYKCFQGSQLLWCTFKYISTTLILFFFLLLFMSG
ncbi:hypothetical protein PENTCL1PPCAC_13650 [Pristionchus entomophagus]|uniref:G protein-coupled receptor n=1 Tax=Pristionchus entomophagus TaxID=358040 RepID=A0AAV5T7D4_9BILA|nr:hypothetical protein PENTCL1PPCAC_13650 [Pristionchus entomophagus]